MCLHNFIRDSALQDEHFDMFENADYFQDNGSATMGVNVAPVDDGIMGNTRDNIADALWETQQQ